MRHQHARIIATASIFTLGLAGEILKHTIGVPINHELLHSATILAGFATVAVYCTNLVTKGVEEAVLTLKGEYLAETKMLHTLIATEIDNYGDKVRIDAHVTNERRHLRERLSGECTVELGERFGGQHRRNVTPLLRRNA
jgi:hypothetical protein